MSKCVKFKATKNSNNEGRKKFNEAERKDTE